MCSEDEAVEPGHRNLARLVGRGERFDRGRAPLVVRPEEGREPLSKSTFLIRLA